MQTKVNAALFPPGLMTTNGAPRLPSEGNKSESMKSLGYLVFSLTAAFCSMLILNTSNSHYHQHSELLQLQHMLPGIVFHALVHLKLEYARRAWQPWLSNTNITSLDRLRNQALRLITEQLVSTLLEALRLKSGVQSYYTESESMIV